MTHIEGPLTAADIDHFLQYGFVKLEQCFDTGPGSLAAQWVQQSWQRNGLSPDKPEDWPGKLHMPARDHVDVAELSPKAWGAICQLCGGGDRINKPTWSDALIINYNFKADDPLVEPGPHANFGWHKDGDFFIHFLDSPEQALLTIVLWSDVESQAGSTWIAPDSIPLVAQSLNEDRRGHQNSRFGRLIEPCSDVREATGKAGDVYLMHPYMLHCASPNWKKQVRIITNPPVHFLEPMQFNRPDGAYSPVEQCVLNALGVESLDYKIEAERQRVVPDRIARQQKMREEEDQRLAAKG